METDYEYGEEGPRPIVSPARRNDTEAFAATLPDVMRRNIGNNPSADPRAASIVMQKTHQLEQQLVKTRMLLQQREQGILDDAYRVAANSSSFESRLGASKDWLAGARRPVLYPRIQALQEQRLQIENGLIPTHHAGLASSQKRLDSDLKRPYLHEGARLGPLKKRSTDQASSVEDPPVILPPDPEHEDHVDEKGDDEAKESEKPQCTNKSKVKSFPHKLYRMLEDAEKNDQEDILSFSPDGRAFVIHQPSKFMEVIMPRYFNTTRWLSFQRQLQIYGFRRVAGCNKGGYYHTFFQKGKKELVEKITRKVSSRAKPTSCTENFEEAVRSYQRATSGIQDPSSQFFLQNSPWQQDLISQSLSMNMGGQRHGLQNNLLGFPQTSPMDLSSDPSTFLGSLVQGGNSSIRRPLAVAGIGESGLSGDLINAFLLRQQQESELLIERLHRRNQEISDALHLLS